MICNKHDQSVSLSTTSGISWPVRLVRALTHVPVHFRVRFILKCPPSPPRRLFSPSPSAFVIFCSPAPPRITLCDATKTMFLLSHSNRAFFPVSFRVDPSQAQNRGSSGALPRSGFMKRSRDKNLVGGEHIYIYIYIYVQLRP